MSYIIQSIRTKSYWRYAILSKDGAKTFFAVLGSVWLLGEIGDKFHIFDYNKLPSYSLYVLLFLSLLIVIFTRSPVSKIKYKLAGSEISIEVKIGDIFEQKGQKVISCNTTFDTDIASGIISPNSLQGQFTQTFFAGRINELDRIIDDALLNIPSTPFTKRAGKNKKYPIGTAVRINLPNEIYYFLAVADLNFDNTAFTTLENVVSAAESAFKFIAEKGEHSDIVVPLFGTGRGRITTNRKRVIARIAQAFIKASEQQHFSNKLIIMIHKSDAENFGINLHEVRDLLNNYLP